jgi:hypothetical protein
MNKNLIWGVVVVLVVGGLAWWMLSDGMPSGDAPEAEDVMEEEEGAQRGGVETLRGLLASQTSQKCEFEDQEENNRGLVYVAGGKMRGDFTSEIDGRNVTTHMIVRDGSVYIWVDGQGEGFTTTLSATEEATTAGAQSPNLDEQVDYNCEGWTSIESFFTIPGGVEFMDINAAMQGAVQGSVETP